MTANVKNDKRKALISEYQQQKRAMGVYCIVNEATGSRFIGSSLNLHAVWGRIKFELQMKSSKDTALQREWDEHGESCFRFEVLEELKLQDELRYDYQDLHSPEGYRREVANSYKKKLDELELKWKS